MIIYFDMDGVIADYKAQADTGMSDRDARFFLEIPPIPEGIAAFKRLSAEHECYILSTAPWSKEHSWSGKRIWVEKHLGEDAFKRLILSHNKQLLRGDILIDDRTANGAGDFQGKHIHFGQPPFENWTKVLEYIENMDSDEALLQSLFDLIERKLQDCDSETWPTICDMRKTPAGLDMVKKYVAEKIINNDNLTVMQAILLTEQEYSINFTE